MLCGDPLATDRSMLIFIFSNTLLMLFKCRGVVIGELKAQLTNQKQGTENCGAMLTRMVE